MRRWKKMEVLENEIVWYISHERISLRGADFETNPLLFGLEVRKSGSDTQPIIKLVLNNSVHNNVKELEFNDTLPYHVLPDTLVSSALILRDQINQQTLLSALANKYARMLMCTWTLALSELRLNASWKTCKDFSSHNWKRLRCENKSRISSKNPGLAPGFILVCIVNLRLLNFEH